MKTTSSLQTIAPTAEEKVTSLKLRFIRVAEPEGIAGVKIPVGERRTAIHQRGAEGRDCHSIALVKTRS